MKARGNVRKMLVYLGKVQNLVGSAQGIYDNDRVSNRADRIRPVLQEAFDLCVEARGLYDPITERKEE